MAADDPRKHVIYRGCTHPATYFGVPMVPFILTLMTIGLLGFWALLLLGFWWALSVWLFYIPVFVVLRGLSRKDPYTLLQLGQRIRIRIGHRNKARWGATTYTPFRYR